MSLFFKLMPLAEEKLPVLLPHSQRIAKEFKNSLTIQIQAVLKSMYVQLPVLESPFCAQGSLKEMFQSVQKLLKGEHTPKGLDQLCFFMTRLYESIFKKEPESTQFLMSSRDAFSQLSAGGFLDYVYKNIAPMRLSLLQFAIVSGNDQVSTLILANPRFEKLRAVDYRDNSCSRTAADWAILSGKFDLAKMCIVAMSKESLSEVDELGNSALHFAFMMGDESVKTLLLSAGLDKRQKNKFNAVPSDYVHLLDFVPTNFMKGPEKITTEFLGFGLRYVHHAYMSPEALVFLLTDFRIPEAVSAWRNEPKDKATLPLIDTQKEFPVYVDVINAVKKRGLRASEDIKKGTYLGTYAGQVRTTFAIKNPDSTYVLCSEFVLDRDLEVEFVCTDALTQGNHTRYMNHSSQPNVIEKDILHRGFFRTCFFANRDIKKGEELTFNYGEACITRLKAKGVVFE